MLICWTTRVENKLAMESHQTPTATHNLCNWINPFLRSCRPSPIRVCRNPPSYCTTRTARLTTKQLVIRISVYIIWSNKNKLRNISLTEIMAKYNNEQRKIGDGKHNSNNIFIILQLFPLHIVLLRSCIENID